jgi:hypothetical protein
MEILYRGAHVMQEAILAFPVLMPLEWDAAMMNLKDATLPAHHLG